MQFTIEFTTDHLERVLASARHEIDNPGRILNAVGEELFRENARRHEAGKSPDGQDWKALSPMTLAKGDRKGGPLKKTGSMLESLTKKVPGDTLILGFDEPRVKGQGTLPGFHQRGHDRSDSHPGLPKRELIGFPDSDKHLVEHVTVDYLNRILSRVR